jgi:hypothetical protein
MHDHPPWLNRSKHVVARASSLQRRPITDVSVAASVLLMPSSSLLHQTREYSEQVEVDVAHDYRYDERARHRAGSP